MSENIPNSSSEENPQETVSEDRELQKADLGQLADWIDEYRLKFGPISRLVRSGIFLTEEEKRERAERLARDGGDPEEEEVRRAKSAQADIMRRNEKLTEQVGLSLDFSSNEGAEWALEMKLDIGDGKKFTAYLHALQKITESQAKGLIKIAEVLTQQITHGYDLTDPEDERLLEIMASLKTIVSEYVRIAGIHPSLETVARQLEEVYLSVQEGCLKEYIMAKDAKLFDSVGEGFGPSTWQRDISEDGYISYWNNALETLEEIKKSPKAKGLYERARGNLLASLEYSEKEMIADASPLLNNKISNFIKNTRERLRG